MRKMSETRLAEFKDGQNLEKEQTKILQILLFCKSRYKQKER